MKEIEIRAQYITMTAWGNAVERGMQPKDTDKAIKEKCDYCNNLRGIGYVWWTLDGRIRCWLCEVEALFHKLEEVIDSDPVTIDCRTKIEKAVNEQRGPISLEKALAQIEKFRSVSGESKRPA